MPYNGVGVFSGLTPPTYPAVAGEVIDPDYFNAIMADIFAGLTTAITRNGQSTPTANLPMGGFKHTGCADATANDQYATYGQLLAAGGGGGVDTTAVFNWTNKHTWTTGGDPGILTTENTNNRIARTSVAGGGGAVRSPLVIDHKVINGTTSFEWGQLTRVSNYDAAGAGENVAVYGQGWKYEVAGKQWGGVFEAQDFSGNSGAGILCGVEINVFANGSAGAASRVGMQLSFGKAQSGLSQSVVGVAIDVTPNSGNRTLAKLSDGMKWQIDVDGAVFKLQNSMNAKYLIEAENANDLKYFFRAKTTGNSMFIPSAYMTTLGGGLRIVIDTYEYIIPFYGYTTATGPIAM